MGSTRREFLGAGAALAVGTALGGSFLGCRSGLDFDVCVIGSGFAGTHVALEAVGAGWRTLILEAGSRRRERPRDPRFGGAFEFRLAGDVRWPVNRARAIAVGGTSNKWAGKVNRLLPEDLELRSRYGLAVDWPISYDDLDPYYCRAEELLSVTGFETQPGEPRRNCEYANLRGDYSAPDSLFDIENPGFFGVAESARVQDPVRLARQEIPRFEASPLATLSPDSQVIRIASLDGRSVDHVVASTGEGNVEIRARIFVLAAGGIESPRILLASTSDQFPAGLGNDDDLVGRHFAVHPNEQILIRTDRAMEISPGDHRTHVLTEGFRRRGMFGCSFQAREYEGRGVEWKMQPEIEPRVENRVRLSSEDLDENGTPLPVVELSYSECDRRLFAEGRQILVREAKRLSGNGASPRRRHNWRKHPSGTCRMGFSPATGVVDSDCRVFGLDNLFVSGASVFPTNGTSNPTLTVVALALRLADHLIERVL